MDPRSPVFPRASGPDDPSLSLPEGRPAMPTPPVGAPPLARSGREARRALEAAWRLAETAGRRGGGSARTDLAVEALQWLQGRAAAAVQQERRQGTHAAVHRVRVADELTARSLGKAPGTYVTVESPGLRERSQQARDEVLQLVAEELERMLREQGVGPDAPVLVAGLGNWNATPDSLGPRVVGQLLVTRHIHRLLPPEKRGSLRPVAAVSPGVLGLTGIETSELVSAVVRQVSPAALICVDALAAGSPQRLCATVQLSDAGIQPGAGVGNVRRALNRQELGIPVVALGVPTVIHASRLAAADGAPAQAGAAPSAAPGAFPPLLGGARAGATPMAPAPAPAAAADAGWLASLVVTPKEIDVLVEDAAELLAGALNAALHRGVELDEVLRLVP